MKTYQKMIEEKKQELTNELELSDQLENLKHLSITLEQSLEHDQEVLEAHKNITNI
ncbi:MAG: hypothetical protein U0518_00575 [Candidatus Gracilibacteria bacterium]